MDTTSWRHECSRLNGCVSGGSIYLMRQNWSDYLLSILFVTELTCPPRKDTIDGAMHFCASGDVSASYNACLQSSRKTPELREDSMKQDRDTRHLKVWIDLSLYETVWYVLCLHYLQKSVGISDVFRVSDASAMSDESDSGSCTDIDEMSETLLPELWFLKLFHHCNAKIQTYIHMVNHIIYPIYLTIE